MKDSIGDEYPSDAMQCEATRLMTAVQAGDHAAFDDLARSLRGRAFQVARALVGSQDDAMELCQETFLKVFRSRESYDPSQPFLPWFHRILRNTCFSFLRKHRRVRERSLTSIGADGEEIDFEIVDPGPGPSAGVERDERRVLFQRAMGQLSSRDREIIALRHFQELSYKQIAGTLGIPEGTVMSRLFHARRRLRETLAPLLDEEVARSAGEHPADASAKHEGTADASAKHEGTADASAQNKGEARR
ncbi:MAG: RNA polymerase sigma factor [Planctomycetota bacterium]